MYTLNIPITKKQVQELKPDPFEPVYSYTRFKDGTLVPLGHAKYSKPRIKREYRPDLGKYVEKMRRP